MLCLNLIKPTWQPCNLYTLVDLHATPVLFLPTTVSQIPLNVKWQSQEQRVNEGEKRKIIIFAENRSGRARKPKFWPHPVIDAEMHGRHAKKSYRSRFVCAIVANGRRMVLGTAPRGLAMAKTDATWIELNPDTLTAEIAFAYGRYKEMYREMKAQRTAFEDALGKAAELPSGKRMVFGYNFGKLSVAIVDDDRKPAKATPAKQSLAEFIASQAQAGRRA